MKRAILLSGLASLCLFACGDDEETTQPTSTSTASSAASGTGGGGTTSTTTTSSGTGGEGGGTRGGLCSQYCDAVTSACSGESAQYDDEADCLAYCGAAGWPEGSSTDQSGNTLFCRIYHAGVAASDPSTHCPHAGPSGADVCGSVGFAGEPSSAFARVDRMGMPAVASVLVSGSQKNAYNDGNPATDTAANHGAEFIAALTTLHEALDDDLTAAGLTPCSMTATVNGLPECIGQEVAPGVKVADLVLPDTLTLDTTKAAGFPNGRKPEDRVIDVTLAVVLLKLTSPSGCGGEACTPATLVGLSGGAGLNPGKNDVDGGAFPASFPYLHPPHAAP